MQAMLHIFVRSRKYLSDNNIKHPSNMKFVNIEIAQVLKGETHSKFFDSFENVSIPENDDGKYMQFNVTDLVTEWFSNKTSTSHSIIIKIEFNGAQIPHRVLSLNLDATTKVSLKYFAHF